MNESLPFRIRPLESRDIPTVMNIDRIVFREPWPESAYVQELYFNPNAHYFILQLTPSTHKQWWVKSRRPRSESILGFVGMRVEKTKGHISTLAVRPKWRGRGLGEWLLVTAIHQAIKDGADTVTLEVRISNEIAQDLYTKYGFVTISRLYHYYGNGEDAFLMRAGPMRESYQQRLVSLYEALIDRVQAQVVEV